MRTEYERGFSHRVVIICFLTIILLIIFSLVGCSKEPETVTCYECHNRTMVRFTYCAYDDQEWSMTVAYWIERGDPLECKTIKTELP